MRRRRRRRKRGSRHVGLLFGFLALWLLVLLGLGRSGFSNPFQSVDVGLALHPATLPPSLAESRSWSVPPTHRLAYGLGEPERDGIDAAYDRIKRRYLGGQVPRDVFDRIYRGLVRTNRAAVQPIADRFQQLQATRELDAAELAQVIVTYVQEIPYRIPEEDEFGLLPPALVVNTTGDCDSKALLALMLLRRVGIEAILLVSNSARHAMLGVGVPLGDDRRRFDGRTYAVTEVTQPNWPIGRMPPRYASAPDWRVSPVRER